MEMAKINEMLSEIQKSSSLQLKTTIKTIAEDIANSKVPASLEFDEFELREIFDLYVEIENVTQVPIASIYMGECDILALESSALFYLKNYPWLLSDYLDYNLIKAFFHHEYKVTKSEFEERYKKTYFKWVPDYQRKSHICFVNCLNLLKKSFLLFVLTIFFITMFSKENELKVFSALSLIILVNYYENKKQKVKLIENSNVLLGELYRLFLYISKGTCYSSENFLNVIAGAQKKGCFVHPMAVKLIEKSKLA